MSSGVTSMGAGADAPAPQARPALLTNDHGPPPRSPAARGWPAPRHLLGVEGRVVAEHARGGHGGRVCWKAATSSRTLAISSSRASRLASMGRLGLGVKALEPVAPGKVPARVPFTVGIVRFLPYRAGRVNAAAAAHRCGWLPTCGPVTSPEEMMVMKASGSCSRAMRLSRGRSGGGPPKRMVRSAPWSAPTVQLGDAQAVAGGERLGDFLPPRRDDRRRLPPVHAVKDAVGGDHGDDGVDDGIEYLLQREEQGRGGEHGEVEHRPGPPARRGLVRHR